MRDETMSAVRDRKAISQFWLIILLAAGALALVTWWVADGGINRGEALKTGGLAAGSIVAMYALWINDRRRRVEEQRHALESQRTEHDRERVADERFARAVELLGHEADQVRVGAMHALAGLARSRERYTQIVLDVLCAYLRRPFELPETDDDEGIREQQVRVTAQRLIADLLPHVSDVDPPLYNLDLHGATLEYFDISFRVVGELRARRTRLCESTSFKGLHVRGPAWFTDARCPGRLYAPGVVFHDRSWFSKFESDGIVDFKDADFRGETKFAKAIFRARVSFADAVFAGTYNFDNVKVPVGDVQGLPDGYAVVRFGAEFLVVRGQQQVRSGSVGVT
jgi:pentapeptide repeat protein